MWSSWSSWRVPSMRFLVDSSASTMHAYLRLGRIRIATSFLVRSSPDLARHCCWHRNFQLSPRIFDSFFELRIHWINEVNTAQSSSVVKLNLPALSSFGLSIAHFWFSFVSLLLTCLSISLATSSQAWMSFVFFVNRSPHYEKPIWRFFVQCGESCEPRPRTW